MLRECYFAAFERKFLGWPYTLLWKNSEHKVKMKPYVKLYQPSKPVTRYKCPSRFIKDAPVVEMIGD